MLHINCRVPCIKSIIVMKMLILTSNNNLLIIYFINFRLTINLHVNMDNVILMSCNNMYEVIMNNANVQWDQALD